MTPDGQAATPDEPPGLPLRRRAAACRRTVALLGSRRRLRPPGVAYVAAGAAGAAALAAPRRRPSPLGALLPAAAPALLYLGSLAGGTRRPSEATLGEQLARLEERGQEAFDGEPGFAFYEPVGDGGAYERRVERARGRRGTRVVLEQRRDGRRLAVECSQDTVPGEAVRRRLARLVALESGPATAPSPGLLRLLGAVTDCERHVADLERRSWLRMRMDVDGVRTRFHYLTDGAAWAATVRLGDVRVTIVARGVGPQHLRLRRVEAGGAATGRGAAPQA